MLKRPDPGVPEHVPVIQVYSRGVEGVFGGKKKKLASIWGKSVLDYFTVFTCSLLLSR